MAQPNKYTKAVFRQLTSNPHDRLAMMQDLAITGAPYDQNLAACLGLKLEAFFPKKKELAQITEGRTGDETSTSSVSTAAEESSAFEKADRLERLCEDLHACIKQRFRNYSSLNIFGKGDELKNLLARPNDPLPEAYQAEITLPSEGEKQEDADPMTVVIPENRENDHLKMKAQDCEEASKRLCRSEAAKSASKYRKDKEYESFQTEEDASSNFSLYSMPVQNRRMTLTGEPRENPKKRTLKDQFETILKEIRTYMPDAKDTKKASALRIFCDTAEKLFSSEKMVEFRKTVAKNYEKSGIAGEGDPKGYWSDGKKKYAELQMFKKSKAGIQYLLKEVYRPAAALYEEEDEKTALHPKVQKKIAIEQCELRFRQRMSVSPYCFDAWEKDRFLKKAQKNLYKYVALTLRYPTLRKAPFYDHLIDRYIDGALQLAYLKKMQRYGEMKGGAFRLYPEIRKGVLFYLEKLEKLCAVVTKGVPEEKSLGEQIYETSQDIVAEMTQRDTNDAEIINKKNRKFDEEATRSPTASKIRTANDSYGAYLDPWLRELYRDVDDVQKKQCITDVRMHILTTNQSISDFFRPYFRKVIKKGEGWKFFFQVRLADTIKGASLVGKGIRKFFSLFPWAWNRMCEKMAGWAIWARGVHSSYGLFPNPKHIETADPAQRKEIEAFYLESLQNVEDTVKMILVGASYYFLWANIRNDFLTIGRRPTKEFSRFGVWTTTISDLLTNNLIAIHRRPTILRSIETLCQHFPTANYSYGQKIKKKTLKAMQPYLDNVACACVFGLVQSLVEKPLKEVKDYANPQAVLSMLNLLSVSDDKDSERLFHQLLEQGVPLGGETVREIVECINNTLEENSAKGDGSLRFKPGIQAGELSANDFLRGVIAHHVIINAQAGTVFPDWVKRLSSQAESVNRGGIPVLGDRVAYSVLVRKNLSHDKEVSQPGSFDEYIKSALRSSEALREDQPKQYQQNRIFLSLLQKKHELYRLQHPEKRSNRREIRRLAREIWKLEIQRKQLETVKAYAEKRIKLPKNAGAYAGDLSCYQRYVYDGSSLSTTTPSLINVW